MTVRPPPRTPVIRVRTALLLVGAVIVAHLLVLRGVAENLLSYPGPMQTRIFSTRAVQMPPAAKPATALPRQPVSRSPKPSPAPAPRRAARPRTDGVLSAAARPPQAQAPVSAPPPPPPEPPVELPVALPVEPPVAAPVVAAEPTLPASSPPAAAEPAPAVAAAMPSPAPSDTAEPPALAASAPTIAQATPTPVQAVSVPAPIRLSFEATGKRGHLNYKAMGELTWLHDGSHYEMRMEMGDWLIGKRVLTSIGDIATNGLAPTRFSDKFRSERAAHFDRQLGRITFSANTAPATLLPGAQDQVSIFAQLAALVGGDPLAFPIGATVTIQTAGPRDAEPWVFAVEREEMLYLPGGHVPALKLVRMPNKDYGQKIELWLAPELGFLPARIKLTFANGDYLDQQWTSSRTP